MKIASRKKKIPSIANNTPKTGPNLPVNTGHRSPNSNDSTVPVTAPTAKVKRTSPAIQAAGVVAAKIEGRLLAAGYKPLAVRLAAGNAVHQTGLVSFAEARFPAE